MSAWASLADRFWAKVDRNGPVHPDLGTACWMWTGARKHSFRGDPTYGTLAGTAAHRIAWVLTHGPIVGVDGHRSLSVCHRCDNHGCVRPDHLFLGTHAENMADAAAHGLMGWRPAGLLRRDAWLAAYARRVDPGGSGR